MPTYLDVKLDKALTYRHHLETLCKKLSTTVSLLWRLAGSGWGTGAKTLRTVALSLIYSTAEYCAPAWYRILASLTAFLMTLCALPLDAYVLLQPTTFLFSQASSQLSFVVNKRHSPWASRSTLDPGHILHGQVTEPQAASKERQKSRHQFAPAARKLLHNLSELDICAA